MQKNEYSKEQLEQMVADLLDTNIKISRGLAEAQVYLSSIACRKVAEAMEQA